MSGNEPKADKGLFNRLLRAMATGEHPEEKPKAKAGTSAKAPSEGCDAIPLGYCHPVTTLEKEAHDIRLRCAQQIRARINDRKD